MENHFFITKNHDFDQFGSPNGPKRTKNGILELCTFSDFGVFHPPEDNSIFLRKTGPEMQMPSLTNFESYSLTPAQCRTVLMRAGDIREYFSLKKGAGLPRIIVTAVPRFNVPTSSRLPRNFPATSPRLPSDFPATSPRDPDLS